MDGQGCMSVCVCVFVCVCVCMDVGTHEPGTSQQTRLELFPSCDSCCYGFVVLFFFARVSVHS